MTTKDIVLVILGVVIFIGILMIGLPMYRVWSQELKGKANLREAEWSKQIAIEEAKANNESATLQAEAKIKQETANAESEVIRAKGVAEANAIIAQGLGGADGYLKYLYINTLKDLETQLIYVPTEAGLPILEAGKR